MPGPRYLVLVIFLLLAMAFVPLVQGQGVDETIADEWVEADYRIWFDSFDHLWMFVTFELYEADLGLDHGIPATELREMIGKDKAVLDGLKDAMREEQAETVNETLDSLDLENATVEQDGPYLVSMGTNVSGDLYNEPLTFGSNVSVSLAPSALGLPSTSKPDDLVKGTLKMGGVLNLGFGLRAKAGHLNIFKFTPPSTIVFMAGQAKTSTMVVTVDARNETMDMTLDEGLVFASEAPSRLEESLKADAHIDIERFDKVNISVDVLIEAVDATDISPLFPDVLGLDQISADGIRMAVENDILTWDDIYGIAIQDEVWRIEGQISEFMEGDVKLGFSWIGDSLVGYNLSVMKGPSIRAVLVYNGSLDLFGMSTRMVETALDSGAEVPFEIQIDTEFDWRVELVMPKDITLEGTGLISIPGPQMRESFTWKKGYGKISGLLVSQKANEEIHYGQMTMRIEVLGADTDLGRILGQRTTRVDFKIDIEVSIEAVPVTGNLSSLVPMEVHMLTANTDFIRTVLDEGLVDESYAEELLDDMRPGLNDRISSIVGAWVDVRLFVDEPTLNINSSGPIKVKGSAKASKEKNIDSLDSIEHVIEVGQAFPLVGKWGWNVAYEIKMPEGVEIMRIDRELPESELAQPIKISKDRRTFIEVLDGDVTDNVTIYAKPTFVKTVAEALPQPLCFIPIILVMVTLVTIPYWFVRRRRLAKEEEKEVARMGLDDYKKLTVKTKGRRRPTGPRTPKVTIPIDDVPILEMGDHPPPLKRRKEGPRPKEPQKKVRCPKCGRRFSVDPHYSGITCPHCGHKGRITVKKEYKRVMCPRCKHPIKYEKGATTLKCGNCGKEGRVKAK